MKMSMQFFNLVCQETDKKCLHGKTLSMLPLFIKDQSAQKVHSTINIFMDYQRFQGYYLPIPLYF